MDSIQDLGQNLIGSIKMPQIGPGIAPADPAAAIGIERALVGGVSGLLDRILPWEVNSKPCRAARVGSTQSIMSTPALAYSTISSGVPTPIR